MKESIATQKSYEVRSAKDSIKLVAWIFVWMASLVVSDKAALYGWWESEGITIFSIFFTAALGFGVLLVFRKMLSRMDDLQRKIQLDALAVALGISLVGCAVYSLLVTWGYIQDEEVTDIFVLMCVSYSAGILFSVVKYR